MALRNIYENRRYTENRRNPELDRPISYKSDKQKSRLFRGGDYSTIRHEDIQADYDYQRPKNIYGGDTANYGNANQGGFDRSWWEQTRQKVRSWFGVDEDDNRPYSGQYTGRGPKNYKRVIHRIYEDVCDRLMEDEYIDASDIEVIMENDVVVLKGTVPTRAEKRHAEDVAASVRGVSDVQNELRVSQREIPVR